MIGTSAMYVYAASAIVPTPILSVFESSLDDTKIAVGPSAPPIIAIEAHSAAVIPRSAAPMNVKKIPPCAAAPSRKLFGFAISGPKSVIAPIPRNISGG